MRHARGQVSRSKFRAKWHSRRSPPTLRLNPSPDNPVPPDCLGCGVCCHSRLDTYVRVSGDDWERLGEQAESAAHFIGNRAYMRMRDGRCAALRVERDTGRFFCTLYERRPQICRDLGRGSPECRGELATKAARPGQREG